MIRSPKHPSTLARGLGSMAPAETLPVAPVLSAELPTRARSAPDRALLDIHIEATIKQGMLAIFADHNLLLTAQIHPATPHDPVRLKQVLRIGPHQLRVALYRADKSLQIEKEGLAEIHRGSANLLKIRVSHHPKRLMWRDTSLEVVWPGATATQPSQPQSAGVPALAAVAAK